MKHLQTINEWFSFDRNVDFMNRMSMTSNGSIGVGTSGKDPRPPGPTPTKMSDQEYKRKVLDGAFLGNKSKKKAKSGKKKKSIFTKQSAS